MEVSNVEMTRSDSRDWFAWVDEYKKQFFVNYPSRETRRTRLAELRIRLTYVDKEVKDESIRKRRKMDMTAKIEALKELGV